jgi:DNA-directed RNA polymerase specialized sigma24 family protein
MHPSDDSLCELDLDTPRVLESLNENQRSTVFRVLQGYRPSEIARQDGVTRNGIAERMKKITRKLRQELAP